MKVPFMQFAGVYGQMLVEYQVNGFYVVFPGPGFELPTKLAQIAKLKSAIKTLKHVMDMYGKMSQLLDDLKIKECQAFDDIFKIDDPIASHSICDPWWTPKKAVSSHKAPMLTLAKETEEKDGGSEQ